MRVPLASLILSVVMTGSALAEDATTSTDKNSSTDSVAASAPGVTATMQELLESGYEIKAAVPSGTSKVIIFMQNEKSAYACEFSNVENTRCGSIN